MKVWLRKGNKENGEYQGNYYYLFYSRVRGYYVENMIMISPIIRLRDGNKRIRLGKRLRMADECGVLYKEIPKCYQGEDSYGEFVSKIPHFFWL